MELKNTADAMSEGRIAHQDRMVSAAEIEWIEHPKFKGVFLKHLVTGQDTDNQISCHMVKIEPEAVLEEHTHPGQWELHEVIDGYGTCILENKEISYSPGTMAVIRKAVRHKVMGGKNGLVLLAKFFPPLI